MTFFVSPTDDDEKKIETHLMMKHEIGCGNNKPQKQFIFIPIHFEYSILKEEAE